MVRDLPRQTAEVHLALHRLDPTPLSTRSAKWQQSSGSGPTSPRPPTTNDPIHWPQASHGSGAMCPSHGHRWCSVTETPGVATFSSTTAR
jgi:hypothetical protein